MAFEQLMAESLKKKDDKRKDKEKDHHHHHHYKKDKAPEKEKTTGEYSYTPQSADARYDPTQPLHDSTLKPSDFDPSRR